MPLHPDTRDSRGTETQPGPKMTNQQKHEAFEAHHFQQALARARAREAAELADIKANGPKTELDDIGTALRKQNAERVRRAIYGA